MPASLTLTLVTNDAVDIARLRKKVDDTFPDGELATKTVPELWQLLNKFRARISNVHALDVEHWSADTAASVASYARALHDASLHPRCGFLAEPQARDARAEELADIAERRLHDLCPEICRTTDELSVRLELPREQARVLGVWLNQKEQLPLSAAAAWDLLKVLDRHEAAWRKILQEKGLDGAAEHLAGFVAEPHKLPYRGLGPLLHTRVGADIIIRTGYDGRHARAALLAATVTHLKLYGRFEPLRDRLRFAGEPDTGVATLRAALLDHACEIGAAAPAPPRRLPPAPPARGSSAGGAAQDQRKPGPPAR